MNSKLLTVLTISALLGGSKAAESQESTNQINSPTDLVFVTDNAISFGYYKSSIVKVNRNIRVWLNMPKSNIESKIDIERISEILVEISCPLQEVKIIKTADVLGKTISEASDDKWEIPSPTQEMFKVILSVCKEDAAQ